MREQMTARAVGGFSRVTPIAFIVFGGQYAQALVTLFALQLAPLLGRHTLRRSLPVLFAFARTSRAARRIPARLLATDA